MGEKIGKGNDFDSNPDV